MASLLLHILERLRSENLHGPTSPYPPHQQGGRSRPPGAGPLDNRESWILLDDEFGDLDSKDPRWPELFLEFFVEGGADGNDDLLFFVKQPPAPDSTNGQDGGDQQDPILVRRKVGNTMPQLDHVIDWKQTFFLNLIVQLPCTLTVAVCKRGENGERKRSLIANASQERIVLVGNSNPALNEVASPVSGTPTLGSPTGNGGNGSASATSGTGLADRSGSSLPRPKSKMVALQRIPKTVYAAPYKSRMDVKDAFMNECSYPLVYYTVNDYESHDLHLSIRENEYLCVELSVIIPDEQTKRDVGKWTATSGTDRVASISVDDDPAPFPAPPGCSKIVIFQGAVPYTSLLDIYQQKGLAARNQLKLGWKKLTEHGNGGRKGGDISPPHERTEYIMMRGPHGKGQCQVAIKDAADAPGTQKAATTTTSANEDAASADSQSSPALSGSPRKPASLADRLLKFGNVVKTQIAASGVLGVDAASAAHDNPDIPKPESLTCSMTYVNVPWQSIISDLADHASRPSA
ncbi:hypothetical protein DFJ77DRAFT_546453 [Powellomyces hirtus]|nr:hypothetical protein DFJ77DRAFT_546453 [Powellomyces hirtus]